MKKLAVLISLLLVILCLAAPQSVRCQAADNLEASLKKLLTEYDQAWNRKDAKAVEKFLASNYVYFSSTGGTTLRQRTLEFLASPKYIIKSAKRTELTAFLAENTVIISSRWVGNGTYNDEVFNDDQRCSLVFTKEKGSWKLLSEHCTQIVSK